MPRKRGDYKIRLGLTQKPITSEEIVEDFSVLHAYLRMLAFILTLIYRLNAGVRIWGAGKHRSTDQAKRIQLAEATFKGQIKEKLHMKIDTPNQDSGGTSDTGNVAKRFFSSESRPIILELVKGTNEEKAALETLLTNISVILRVMSSNRKIDTESFSEFCRKTYVLLIEKFDWISLSITAHSVLGHCAERIEINDGYGLRNLSEQSLEACHKIIRKAREKAARKDSFSNNISDVFEFMWIKSDPIVREQRRKLHCSKCESDAHTVRGCPDLKEVSQDNDNILVESFFM